MTEKELQELIEELYPETVREIVSKPKEVVKKPIVREDKQIPYFNK